MKELFIEKFWAKPISILIFVIIWSLGTIQLIPENNESITKLIIYLIIFAIATIGYSIYVIKENSLQSCPKNKIGVLFIFKVPTEEQYIDFKYHIEENFKKNTKTSNYDIVPICINSTTLKKYDRTNKTYMEKLLSKVNCNFCVEFFIESNSPNNPTMYSTTIHTGVLLPEISKEATNTLIKNLSFGVTPIKKINFDSNNKINTLDSTTTYLRSLSEYIVGMLLLMYNDNLNATKILYNLFTEIKEDHKLYNMITDALAEASMRVASYNYDQYKKTQNTFYLDEYEKYLELVNCASPGKYEYHLDAATLTFLKYRNINLAKEHINICKKLNENDFWQYSEAFLLAYETNNPNIVYSKYMQLKDNSYNIVNIISFIENVLDFEPDKIILHLAIGILYYYAGNMYLANCHFKQFIFNYSGKIKLRKKSEDKIKSLIDDNLCQENTTDNYCELCKCK